LEQEAVQRSLALACGERGRPALRRIAFMKAVLVPIETHDLIPSVLQTALLFGRRFGSLLEGFALRPIMTEFVPVDMVGGLTWTQNDLMDQGEAERARDAFEAFMRAH